MTSGAPQGSHPVPQAVFSPDRLAAVEAAGLAGTGPEESFDRLARLASSLLATPLAFVTVVDDHRSWYKSFIGGPEGAPRWGAVEESFCQYVVGSDTECIIGDARESELARHNPAVEKMGVVAWAGFPVRAPDGEVLGTLCAVDTRPREWTARDVQVLETLAAAASAEVALRAALRDEQAQRARAEVAARELSAANDALSRTAARAESLAATLSASLLPPRLISVPGLDAAARYRTASKHHEVTGDFYDLFEARPACWSAIMGDVRGKGPHAATLTAEIRYSVRAESAHRAAPSDVLAAVNASLDAGSDEVADPDSEAAERFATAALATFERDGRDWRVTLSLAGHPHPLLRRADGTVEALGAPGLPLGLFPDAPLVDVSVQLRSGDALLLFTDGLTEARAGDEEFGVHRLAEVLAESGTCTAEQLVAHIERRVAVFGQGEHRDDTALMALVAG
jgi:phosphoserine phosphatase RsbU/P